MKKQKKFECGPQSRLIDRLRRALPIAAYPRPPLLAFLSSRGLTTGRAPKLSVVDVFEAGERHGLLCRFSLCGAPGAHGFVAPLSQLALDRRHPLAHFLDKLNTDTSRTAAS